MQALNRLLVTGGRIDDDEMNTVRNTFFFPREGWTACRSGLCRRWKIYAWGRDRCSTTVGDIGAGVGPPTRSHESHDGNPDALERLIQRIRVLSEIAAAPIRAASLFAAAKQWAKDNTEGDIPRFAIPFLALLGTRSIYPTGAPRRPRARPDSGTVAP